MLEIAANPVRLKPTSTNKPVLALRPLRRMRGGTQAYLMEAADGHHYVVKFSDNPQHRRVLVNEYVASILLAQLDIAQPKTRIIEITADLLRENPDLHIQIGNRRREISPGRHFGSRFPGNPITQAVYDILPDALLSKVANAVDFLGVLAFDKWAGNSDARQAIFFRAKIAEWCRDASSNPLQVGFIAQMMDNGYIFDGPNWKFCDAPLFGLFFRPIVYERVRSIDDFSPWIDRIQNFSEEIMDRALREVPEEWLPGNEHSDLERLLEALAKRRNRIADLIEDVTRGRVTPFPNWTRRSLRTGTTLCEHEE